MWAQPVFRGTDILPAEEFAARRAALFSRIGDGAVVIDEIEKLMREPGLSDAAMRLPQQR